MSIEDELEGEAIGKELEAEEPSEDYGDGSVQETFAREYRSLQEDGYDIL